MSQDRHLSRKESNKGMSLVLSDSVKEEKTEKRKGKKEKDIGGKKVSSVQPRENNSISILVLTNSA